MEEALKLYLKTLKRRSERTYRTAGYTVRQFVNYLLERGLTDPEKLAPVHVEGFLEEYGRGKKARTKYAAVHRVAGFLRFIGREDLARQLVPPTYEMEEAAWLTEEDVFKIIEAARDPYAKAAFWLSYELGLRISEVIELKWEDINLEEKTVRVKRLKQRGQLISLKPISEGLANFLSRLPALSEYVICTYGGRGKSRRESWHKVSPVHLERKFREAVEASGINLEKYDWYKLGKKPTFHSLRHSCGVKAAMASGGDVSFVAKVLDHKNPANTLIYIHIAMREMRKVLGR